MKIWFICQYAGTPRTGVAGRHHYLASELALRGHSVKVIAARHHHLLREDVDTQALPACETVNGYSFVRVPVPYFSHAHDTRRILAWLSFARQLARLDRRLNEHPDVIVYSSPSLIGFLGAERLARRVGAALVFEVRDIWPLTIVEIGGRSPGHPFIRFLQWIEDRAYRNADRVISNLPGAVEHMVARGMDRRKFTWIPNGVSLAEAGRPEPLPAQIAVQIPTTGLRIVYTGTLGAANALSTLIDAASMIQDLDDVSILIVGQGKERASLQQKAVDLALGNVTFLGPIPKAQVQSMLNACDVCYIGLTADPLFRFGVSPNKIFDYFYAKRPVIWAIDAGEYAPVEQHGAGLAVQAENPAALAEAIRKLHRMPSQDRHRMGENGYRAVVEHYDYAKLAVKLEEVLSELIATRSVSPQQIDRPS